MCLKQGKELSCESPTSCWSEFVALQTICLVLSDAGMTQPCSPSAGIPSSASVTCTGWLDCIIVLGDSCAVQPSFLELRSRTERRAAAEANNFTLQGMAFISTMDQKKEQPTKSS
ncbi:unnamed protein product [Eretmochelys imbricata]